MKPCEVYFITLSEVSPLHHLLVHLRTWPMDTCQRHCFFPGVGFLGFQMDGDDEDDTSFVCKPSNDTDRQAQISVIMSPRGWPLMQHDESKHNAAIFRHHRAFLSTPP